MFPRQLLDRLSLLLLLLIFGGCQAPLSSQGEVESATPASTATSRPAPSATIAAGGKTNPRLSDRATPTSAAQASSETQPNSDSQPGRIEFAPGATSATIEDSLVRGTQLQYLLNARQGQQMRLSITSLENNAVFSLLDPIGEPLPGAEPGSDASEWSGVLLADGNYTIEVGSTRGNATFKLTVEIDATAPDASLPLRRADWQTLLFADPALQVEEFDNVRYVSVRDSETPVSGVPLLDSILYVDLDQDGEEEAVITLYSGGTAGNIGLLVYRRASPAPQLVAWRDGYKLSATAENGHLVVTNALYAGWEPNCCPSGLAYDSYHLTASGDLALIESRSEGIKEMQVPTVEHFYELLSTKELSSAYMLLSAEVRSANPYQRWAAGYENTIKVQAQVEAHPTIPDTVLVELTATDRTANGSQQVQRFRGTWRLIWDAEQRGWRLTAPNIQPAP